MKNELPKRKNLRLKCFDYSTPGAYFVTVCTFNKQKTLSDIVCTSREDGANASSRMENRLTEYGKIVERIINQMPDSLKTRIDEYVIMPNHIHLIVIIDNSDELRAIRAEASINLPAQRRSVISKTVGYIKMNTSKAIRKEFGDVRVWQRGFYDHIIRDRDDYANVVEYIRYNPLRWQYDSLNSERMKPNP